MIDRSAWERGQRFILPFAIVLLLALGWYFVVQQSQSLTQTTISAYQQTQLEIVRALARSVKTYVSDQMELHGRQDIAELEQEIFQKFIAPVRLLNNGDAWIYAPDYVVFDDSLDFPDEYRGKNMAEIFALQQTSGASNYEDLTQAVMRAEEGVGWYIWLPEKGREIAAWTPVTVGNYVWTIGLSTPLPEILASTGAATQIAIARSIMAFASVLSFGMLVVCWRSTGQRDQAEQALQRAIIALEQSKASLETQVATRTAELVAANSVLQTEVTERQRATQALIEAKEAAEVANQTKSAFLANMSHELRTPLTAILGYSDLIRMQAQHDDCISTTDLFPDVDRITMAGNHLLTLINDLLDIAKIESGKMQLDVRPFALDPLIESVIETVEPIIAKNHNTLIVDCAEDLGVIAADQTKVRQVLLNLLSNAAKFTEQGTVTLQVSRISPTDPDLAHVSFPEEAPTSPAIVAFARFVVHDTGIGIDSEELRQIFEAFRQAAPNNARRYGGTGLGLAISRHFSQMMGGTITAESTLGQGSTFTFYLPFRTRARITAHLSAPDGFDQT